MEAITLPFQCGFKRNSALIQYLCADIEKTVNNNHLLAFSLRLQMYLYSFNMLIILIYKTMLQIKIKASY